MSVSSSVKVYMILDLTVAETSMEQHRSTDTHKIRLATGETEISSRLSRRQMNGERWIWRKSEW